jgi:hypothetical protein
MHGAFASWELLAVWAGAMFLGGLTLHFVHLIHDRGVQVEVSASTLLVFNAAAWAAWAGNALAATLILIQPLLGDPLPFNSWVLGAAFSPLALPLGQMRRVLRMKLVPATSARLSS